MKFLDSIRSMPQPVRSLYYAFVAGVVILVGASLAGNAGWSVTLVGFIAVLMGVTLLTNFRGNADGMAKAVSSYQPRGVDYSKSIMASKTYVRFFGACATLVGLVFLLLGLS